MNTSAHKYAIVYYSIRVLQ